MVTSRAFPELFVTRSLRNFDVVLIVVGEVFKNYSRTLMGSEIASKYKKYFSYKRRSDFGGYVAIDTVTCSASAIVRRIKQRSCLGYLGYETDLCILLGAYVCRICEVRVVGLCEPS